MKFIKQIILGIVLLELINLIIGFVYNGADVFLPYTQFNAPPLYYDMDSLYGVTRQKSTKQMISYPWGGVVCRTDSLGFMDDEFKNNGVLITGNSFVEGYGISTKDRFSEILEKKYKTPKINNAGSGGVWSPLQSLMVLRYLLKDKQMVFKKNIIVLTPGEVVNLDNRSPFNDSNRNFPYRDGDSIRFYKAKRSSFSNEISLNNKIKRFTKSLMVSKIYYIFKYYGAAKVKHKEVDFDKKKMDWYIKQIEKEEFKQKIEIVIINNLGRIKINDIENYSNKSKKVEIHLINYPDGLNNYFASNGHLNHRGNEVLAKLLFPIIKN